MKKEIHQDLIRAEIREYEDRKIELTLIMPEELREKYLIQGKSFNLKPIIRRIEAVTENN